MCCNTPNLVTNLCHAPSHTCSGTIPQPPEHREPSADPAPLGPRRASPALPGAGLSLAGIGLGTARPRTRARSAGYASAASSSRASLRIRAGLGMPASRERQGDVPERCLCIASHLGICHSPSPSIRQETGGRAPGAREKHSGSRDGPGNVFQQPEL